MKIKRGSTSVRRLIFVNDSSSTTGAGLANLAFDTASLAAYYFAGDLSNEVAITLATATLGTWTSGGFVAVDNTNMPGWYEIGIPNSALDGGNECAIQFRGATNMVPVNIYIELDTLDYQTAAGGALMPTVAGRTFNVSLAGEGDAVLNTAARVKLDATQPDYVPATAAALATAYALLQLTDTDVAGMEARLPSDPADQSAVESAIAAVSTKIGTPVSSVSADIAGVKTDTGNLVTRITSTLFSGITYMSRWMGALAGKTADTTTRTEINATVAGATYNETTDSLEAQKDTASTESDLMVSTTIATLSSQTVFTLTAGSPDNDAYNDQLVVVTDASTSTQKSRGIVSDYVASTKTVTLRAAPGFTIAAGDTVSIIAIGSDVSSSQLASAISSAVATAGVSTTVTGIPTFLRVGDARTVANGGAISVRLYDADDDSLLFGLGTQLFADATITFSLRRGGNDGTEGTEDAVIPCTWVASGGDGYVQIAYEGDALDDCDAMDKLKEKDCHRWGIKFQWGTDDPITPVYGNVSVLRKIVSTQ